MKKFLLIWLGQLFSLMGSQLTGFALGVWVYQKTQSTTLFALLTGLNVIPVVLFSPIIGVISDQWPRRRVMICSDLGAGLSTVALAIALHHNYLPISLIALLIFLNATFSSFMRPAYTAATSQLINPKDLDRVSGLMQIGSAAPQLVAPILGGALLQLIGLTGILWIDVITFVFAVTTQLMVPAIPTQVAEQPSTREASGWINEFSQALSFLRSSSGLLALLLFFIFKNFLTSIAYISTTPYVLSFASEVELGSVLSAGGLGMLGGSLILSFLSNARNRIHTISLFSCLSGLTLIVLAFQDTIWNFMLGSFLFFFALPLIHGSGQVIFQRQVPLPLQGRVFAVNEALAAASVPLGYLVAGPLADFVFEPLLQPQGALASSLGQILGIGPGRGIALLFLTLGVCHSIVTPLFFLYSPIRLVDRSPTDPAAEDSLSHDKHHKYSLKAMIDFLNPDISPLEFAYELNSVEPPPSLEPIISIQNLNHNFGKGALAKQVLFDINLTIYPGEIVILTGPSGSGKTTLLTLMGALRSVQDGSLKILDQELSRASNRKLVQIRRNIGYIFQGHNLLPFMTARQNVRMSLSLKSYPSRREALDRVDTVLEEVGLGDRLNYYPSDLSGGQKQRVAIARALVNQSALILADEPTASLDSKTGRDVVQLMYRLAKEQNSTIVLVTHDNRILDVADRIIHLEDGQISLKHDRALSSTLSTVSGTGGMTQMPQKEKTNVALTVPTQTSITTSDSSIDSTIDSSINSTIDSTLEPWKPYKIVCIDDSMTVLSSLKAFLSNDLFSVFLVQDPVQALIEIIKVKPDMIILDIHMPNLDGYQLCTLLRSHPNFKDIPVIAISGNANAFDQKMIEKIGITDCLMKPFDQNDLTKLLFPYLN